MLTLSLTQGTPEWIEHRRQHWNASDCPAMLGISPYKQRSELLREYATGIAPEVDEATQRRFDAGHRYEALARPLAEEIIGEELYPCTGTNGKFSASFDGITLLGDVVFEHKTLNDEIRKAFDAAADSSSVDLPLIYRAQMEHQLLVSGASSVLFMASKWTESGELIEERHCWHCYGDQELRARIVAGWEQFERDIAAYLAPPPATAAPVGRTPENLPALRVEAQGLVTASNLAEFRAHASEVLGKINRVLVTDEDFATAETTVKWCSAVEDRLAATKANVIAQIADVEAVCRTIEDVSAETRRIRLELDRLVRAEKESRKAELVRTGVNVVWAHYAVINATMGEHPLAVPQGMEREIGGAIKGLKTLASMREKIDNAIVSAKIAASQQAEKVRANVAILAEIDHPMLFADRVVLCATKAPDDLRRLAQARVAEHKEREERRERLKAEEAARVEQYMRETAARDAERAEKNRAENERIREQEARELPRDFLPRVADTPREVAEKLADTNHIPDASNMGPQAMKLTCPRIRLGEINALIAPLSISAEGLAQLGFKFDSIDKAAKLYDASRFEAIKSALIGVIARAVLRAAA